MTSLALLVLRLIVGGLMAGHGSQKLFGWFGGYGIKGTGGFMESLGLKPGEQWARLAAASEFGGGVLTALGLLSPVGPITLLAPMAMATGTAHKGKPIWVTSGGAELPVTNMAVASALAIAGPGNLSVDKLLGIRLHWSLVLMAAAGTAAGVAIGLNASRSSAPQTGEQIETQESAAQGAGTEPGSADGASAATLAGQHAP